MKTLHHYEIINNNIDFLESLVKTQGNDYIFVGSEISDNSIDRLRVFKFNIAKGKLLSISISKVGFNPLTNEVFEGNYGFDTINLEFIEHKFEFHNGGIRLSLSCGLEYNISEFRRSEEDDDNKFSNRWAGSFVLNYLANTPDIEDYNLVLLFSKAKGDGYEDIYYTRKIVLLPNLGENTIKKGIKDLLNLDEKACKRLNRYYHKRISDKLLLGVDSLECLDYTIYEGGFDSVYYASITLIISKKMEVLKII